jgi:hypothetical protein
MHSSEVMNTLSPTALRFIDIALRKEGDARNAEEWSGWVKSADSDALPNEIPPRVAQIALHALSGLALHIERALADESVDPGTAVGLESDLGYIADIEGSLSELLFVPLQSAG